MSFTEPKPDYSPVAPFLAVSELNRLGYDLSHSDERSSAIAGLFVSMAEQIEHLKQELSKKQDKL